MASSSSNNDDDLPSSVIGAPEELKAAIRKKQNKEVRIFCTHFTFLSGTDRNKTVFIYTNADVLLQMS